MTMPKFPTRNLLAEAKRISRHIFKKNKTIKKQDSADDIIYDKIYGMRSRNYKTGKRVYFHNKRVV